MEFTAGWKDKARNIGYVTSRHHQTMVAYDEKDSPKELEIIAYATEKVGTVEKVNKNVVEIFKHRTKRIIGVQYHPEDNQSDYLTVDLIKQYLLKGE